MTESDNLATGALYKALIEALPVFVKNPFIDDRRIDVARLRVAVNMSYETVYTWLRTNRLSRNGAVALLTLANSPDNVAALQRLNSPVPTKETFAPFHNS